MTVSCSSSGEWPGMWHIMQSTQDSYRLSDRLIRAVSQWTVDQGDNNIAQLIEAGQFRDINIISRLRVSEQNQHRGCPRPPPPLSCLYYTSCVRVL